MTGRVDDALVVFERDPLTGRLTFLQDENGYGFDVITRPSQVAVSPHGDHVYVTSYSDDGFFVFGRDAASGRVYFVDSFHGTNDNLAGLGGAQTVMVARDGQFVYAGGFTGDAISVIRRRFNTSPTRVTLGPGESVEGPDLAAYAPASITARVYEDLDTDGLRDPGEPWLNGVKIEVIDATSQSVIGMHITENRDLDGDGSIDPATESGRFEFTDLLPGRFEIRVNILPGWEATEPPTSAQQVELGYNEHRDDLHFGNWPMSGEISGQKWHDLNGDGVHDQDEPGLNGWTIELVLPGVGTVVASTTTAAIDLDGDGAIDPVTEAGRCSFADLGRGTIELREVPPPGWVPTFPRTIPSNQVEYTGVLLDPVTDETSENTSVVVVSPDGRHVYASGWTERTESLAAFDRHPDTGQLTRISRASATYLYRAAAVVASPDGRHLYHVARDGNALTVFTRDEGSGDLALVEEHPYWAQGARDGDVAISPDGRHVYAAMPAGNLVRSYVRDEVTGELSVVQEIFDGDPGVSRLREVRSVVVSPDGQHVYVASPVEDAMTVFRRDASTGMLTVVDTLQSGSPGGEWLTDMLSPVISPDGRQIYIDCYKKNSLAVFDRDPVTGHLMFAQVVRDGVDGVDGLHGVGSLAVSPDGTLVIAASIREDELTVLARDTETGSLHVQQVLREQVPGADRFGGRHALAASPDNRHIYAATYSPGTLVVFGKVHTPGPYRPTLRAGEVLENMDFGSYQPTALSGQVFEDLNVNGLRDAGEPGLDGWTVELVDAVTGEVVATQLSAGIDLDGDGTVDPITEQGRFSWGELPPGIYDLAGIPRDGYLATTALILDVRLKLESGDSVGGFVFGGAVGGAIVGQVFEDLNGDGSQDAGEPGSDGWGWGFPGGLDPWRVTLTDSATGVRVSTTTALKAETAKHTLSEELELGEVDVHQVYAAMDWLVKRQTRIENKLAKKHLKGGHLVLFDVSSSYYTGRKSPLIKHG